MARVAENPSIRRKALLRAAKKIIDESGAASLSMRTLAAEAKSSPMSVYELFGSKDGLLIALLQERRTTFVRRMGGLTNGGAIDKLFKTMEFSAGEIEENFNIFQATSFQYFSPNGNEVREIFDPQRNSLIRLLVKKIIKEGYACSVGIESLARQIDNIYLAMLFRWMIGSATRNEFTKGLGMGIALLVESAFDDRILPQTSKYKEKYSEK